VIAPAKYRRPETIDSRLFPAIRLDAMMDNARQPRETGPPKPQRSLAMNKLSQRQIIYGVGAIIIVILIIIFAN
jgi:hypothetical protein